MSGGAKPKKRGTAFEHSVIANLKRAGWPLAIRSYASKGPWDVLAIRSDTEYAILGNRVTVGAPEVWLIQAKIGGYMRPTEREALIEAAHSIGATPVLARTLKRRIVYFKVENTSCRMFVRLPHKSTPAGTLQPTGS